MSFLKIYLEEVPPHLNPYNLSRLFQEEETILVQIAVLVLLYHKYSHQTDLQQLSK